MKKYRDAAKSELEAQRELLDSLMGINRNNDRKGEQVLDFRDDRVCKFYLIGLCPHDIFVNTKVDEGPCAKIHSEALKADFERQGDPYMYDSMIEKEFSNRISEADRQIRRARARVEDEKEDEELNPEINPDIIRIHGEISKVIQEAERAIAADDIDRAQELTLTRLEDLNKEKQGALARINDLRKQRLGSNDKKLRVCDVCGSFLSVLDSDKRLTDHFLGKQHIGFQYMRDSLDAIRKRRDERRSRREVSGGSSSNTVVVNDQPQPSRRREDSRERGTATANAGRYGPSDSSRSGGGGSRRPDSRDRDRGRRREDSRERDRRYRQRSRSR